MTDQSALSDAQIRRLLEHRARRADATGLLEAISTEIAGNPQRAARSEVRLIGWALGAAAAAVLAVAGVAFLRGPSGPGEVRNVPTPPPSATPSATADPSVRPLAPAGLEAPTLEAGTWSTVAFDPAITFTVPADRWSSGLDLPQQVYLRAHLPGAPVDEFDAWTIYRIEDVWVEPCGSGEFGDTRPWTEGAAAFFGWLQAQSSLDLGTPAEVTVLGRPALQIELEVPPGAYSECAEGYLPIAPVEGSPGGGAAIPRIGQRFRMAAVDVDGRTLLVVAFGSPERWDALVAAAYQVLATLEFQ
jgi:hypothetical protein